MIEIETEKSKVIQEKQNQNRVSLQKEKINKQIKANREKNI